MTNTPAAPEGSVIITPAEVYGKVLALTDAVTKMVAADEGDKRERERIDATLADHDRRISGIERKLWILTGAAATAGGALGSMVAPFLAR